MKIAMMARNPNLYSHQRLVEAAEARGHELRIIDTLRVYINVASHRPEMRYQGEKLEGFDAVIPRIGASITSNWRSTAVPKKVTEAPIRGTTAS